MFVCEMSSLQLCSAFSFRDKEFPGDIFSVLQLKPSDREELDLDEVDVSTTLLGHPVNSPVAIAPSAMHKLVHPEGELGTAWAANRAGVCFHPNILKVSLCMQFFVTGARLCIRHVLTTSAVWTASIFSLSTLGTEQ